MEGFSCKGFTAKFLHVQKLLLGNAAMPTILRQFTTAAEKTAETSGGYFLGHTLY